MPGYIPITLQKFQHKPQARPQDAPHPWNKPVYRKHIQFATQQISAPKLNYSDTNIVHSINGTFIYYVQAVDPTMLPALNQIFTCQSAPTQDKMDECNQVLDYTSTHPNATIRYHASDMILMKDTDVSYLVLLETYSSIAEYYYFTNRMLNYSKGNPTPNGPILTECNTLKTVVSFSY